MNRDQILELLDDFSVPTFQRDTPSGGTVVATQRGARVLALFPSREGTNRNVLWVNPNIEAILTGAAKDWEGDGSGGVGGDRLWISPERNFYYTDPKNFGGWFTPREMDPGNYREVGSDATSITYENRYELKDQITCALYKSVTARRKLTLLESPLAGFQPVGKKPVGYAGVASEETIEIVGAEGPAPRVCPWGLTQVLPPQGGAAGTVVIPTARRATPIDYFGGIPADRMGVHEHYVTFRVDAELVMKLAVRAEDLAPSGPVRIAYLSRVPSSDPGSPVTKQSEWTLLVRESEDVARTSDDAVDPAKADPDGPRGVIQTYNCGPSGSDPDYPRFGEIEMQYLPLRKMSDGVYGSTVRSRLMAFQAEKADILSIASRLLGLESIVLFD